MKEALIAVQIALTLAARIQSMIHAAQSAGRELTPEEMATIKAELATAKTQQAEVGSRLDALLNSIIASASDGQLPQQAAV